MSSFLVLWAEQGCVCLQSLGHTCWLFWYSSWSCLSIPEPYNDSWCANVTTKPECIPLLYVAWQWEEAISHFSTHAKLRVSCHSLSHCRQYGLLATSLETAPCAETTYWTAISCPLCCSKSGFNVPYRLLLQFLVNPKFAFCLEKQQWFCLVGWFLLF